MNLRTVASIRVQVLSMRNTSPTPLAQLGYWHYIYHYDHCRHDHPYHLPFTLFMIIIVIVVIAIVTEFVINMILNGSKTRPVGAKSQMHILNALL